MGKKRCRKSYISKGQRRSVATKTPRSAIDKALDKVIARRKGKKVFDTIPNPDKRNTKERFIRVEI